jgi:hypothetical protein
LLTVLAITFNKVGAIEGFLRRAANVPGRAGRRAHPATARRSASVADRIVDALRTAGKPTQITFYRGETSTSQETHIFHIPSNRLAAMQENLDWFDFWLLGREDADAARAEQYRRWRRMHESFAR